MPTRTRAEFLLLALIWGSSFMFIKIGDEQLAPLQVAFGRVVFGAGLLVAVVAISGAKLPRGVQVWKRLAIAAVFFNAGPFSLYAWGETHVSSVVAGIWNATTPLLTVVFALALLPDERPTRRRAAGLALGFCGALLVLGPWRGLAAQSLLGNLACLGAAACYGLGFAYTRRTLAGRDESALALAAAQLVCATFELGLVMPFLSSPPASISTRVIGSIVVLGTIGSGLAYILNLRIIRAAGATVAASVTYVIPVFATVFGLLMLGEPLSPSEPLGAAVIVAGVALAQARPRVHAAR